MQTNLCNDKTFSCFLIQSKFKHSVFYRNKAPRQKYKNIYSIYCTFVHAATCLSHWQPCTVYHTWYTGMLRYVPRILNSVDMFNLILKPCTAADIRLIHCIKEFI